MAQTCPHCKSADLAALFASFECLSCGKHSTTDGRPVLPDSLCIGPNHPDNLAQYGWPYEDQEPSHQRNKEMCAAQWGEPLHTPEAVPAAAPEKHWWET